MTATFNKFNAFTLELGNGNINLSSDTLKVMLTNTAPVATNTLYGDISAGEVANGNGYTTGGNAAALTSWSQSGGVAKLILANPSTWTASGGSIGPFRYAVLYDTTPSSPLKPLIGWYDYGAAVTLTAGEQFQVAFDATNGVFTIT
jgi:hypothetical protein